MLDHDASGRQGGVLDQRWTVLHALRPQLVAFARRQGVTFEEAQDVASEALLRAATKSDLDLTRAHAWTQAVVRNLCVDVHRGRVNPRVMHRLSAQCQDVPDIAEGVAGRAEAVWATGLLATMPPRQRRALVRRAQGQAVEDIAVELATGYKAVESLLSRGRHHLRHALASAGGVAIAMLTFGRRGSRAAAPSLVMASAVAAFGLYVSPTQAPHEAFRPVGEAPRAQSPRPTPAVVGLQSSPQRSQVGRAGQTRVAPTRPPGVGAPVTVIRLPAGDHGVASHEAVEIDREDDGRTIVGSALACLQEGPVVTPQHVGCPTAGHP